MVHLVHMSRHLPRYHSVSPPETALVLGFTGIFHWLRARGRTHPFQASTSQAPEISVMSMIWLLVTRVSHKCVVWGDRFGRRMPDHLFSRTVVHPASAAVVGPVRYTLSAKPNTRFASIPKNDTASFFRSNFKRDGGLLVATNNEASGSVCRERTRSNVQQQL